MIQAELDPVLDLVVKQQAVSQWGNNRWGQITTLGFVGIGTLGFAQFMCWDCMIIQMLIGMFIFMCCLMFISCLIF